eukprot:sb/3469436/
MRFATRLCLLVTLLLLSISTPLLWFRYKSLRQRHISADSSPRPYLRLSNHSCGDVLYTPPQLHNTPHYKLLVLSLSAGAYYKRRSAVRETWLKRLEQWNKNRPDSHLLVHHLFVCFSPKRTSIKAELLTEARQYGDIVVFGEGDKYSHLAAQTLTALDWAHSQFSFDFVLKTDDDSLVNVDQIVGQLDGVGEMVFAGREYRHRHPESAEQREWVAKYHNGDKWGGGTGQR